MRAINAAQDGIWEYDPASGSVWYSDTFLNLVGYTRDDHRPTMEWFLSILHPDDRPRVSAAITAHLEQGQPFQPTYRLRCGSGDYRWFSTRGQAEWDAAGRPVRATGATRDIHDQRLAEEKVREADEQLRQADKMRAIGQLAGGIAHDFNNQLQAILGYADLILGQQPGEELARQVQTIATAAQRSSDLVQQLLAFSRQADSTSEPFDCQALVAETVALLRPTGHAQWPAT